MSMKSLAALLLLAVCVCDAFAASILGRVVGVADGDTVTVLTAEHRQYKIRLSGIDAPEKMQPFGPFSRATLARQLFGELVIVEWTKTDRYGRIVGKIEREGVDVNLRADSRRFGLGVPRIPARTVRRGSRTLSGSRAAGPIPPGAGCGATPIRNRRGSGAAICANSDAAARDLCTQRRTQRKAGSKPARALATADT